MNILIVYINSLHECLARCNYSPDCVAFAQRKQQCFICGDTVPQGVVSGMADSSLWKHIYVSQDALAEIRKRFSLHKIKVCFRKSQEIVVQLSIYGVVYESYVITFK